MFTQPELGQSYNFGPSASDAVSVRHVIEHAQKDFGYGATNFAEQTDGPHEAGLLHLDTDLALTQLGIRPRWQLAQALEKSMQWYKKCLDGADARSLCEADIQDFLVSA
jgi:CDP-glucose 4,6-dehydratase